MKKITSILLFVFCIVAAQTSLAQRRMQHIEALKVAYISQKLDLTPQEAQQFWPVYNQYEKEMQQLRQQRRQNQLNASQLNSANDAAATKSLNSELSFEENVVALRKKYKNEFSKVLPPRKVVLLYQAEKEFTNQLIRQLKERKENKSHP